MSRADADQLTLAMLPSESSKMSLLHEMGIESAQDGVDKVLGGCVRQVDVMVYQDLAPGAKPVYFLDIRITVGPC